MKKEANTNAEVTLSPKDKLESFYFNVFGWEVVKWRQREGWFIKPSPEGEYVPLDVDLSETSTDPGSPLQANLHAVLVEDIQLTLKLLEKHNGRQIFRTEGKEDVTIFVRETNSLVAYGADYAGNWFNLIQHNEDSFPHVNKA